MKLCVDITLGCVWDICFYCKMRLLYWTIYNYLFLYVKIGLETRIIDFWQDLTHSPFHSELKIKAIPQKWVVHLLIYFKISEQRWWRYGFIQTRVSEKIRVVAMKCGETPWLSELQSHSRSTINTMLTYLALDSLLDFIYYSLGLVCIVWK